ncbi:CYFA0S05e02784g1_1 [Cyberlindnera fabianii]|uniref:CYFA0S05e02784g1_1 n=1 Tax=Cyberlindnera fabianii TaxID=36022 RepID=A0A061ATY4_CYBFA|nr:CYFA0S05e02784g1_1 [Cyberlindnera fabianii]
MKTDYYELMGVSTSTTESELKKAYRKMALLYHPDKNPDNVEEATQRFAEIRLAYEVLSDPQERAWYDAHKSQILREDTDGGVNDQEEYVEPEVAGTTVDEIYKFFDPSLYTRKDESPAGMYQIIKRVFNKLASEEILAGRQLGLDGYSQYQDDDPDDEVNVLYPKFGNSKSDYGSEVRRFYQVWANFSTVKTFSWKDEYRYSTAGDRRTRRAMERENKKTRDIARREFNEAVRSFVSFVKKRDPRVKEGAAKFEQERKRKQQEDLRKQIERDRAAHAAQMGQYREQSWQALDNEDLAEMERHFVSDSSDDAEPEDPQLYECVICDKTFKTEKQFKSHENSAKHKKLLKQLKWEMRQEGITLGIDPVSEESDFVSADEANEEDGIADTEDLDVEVDESTATGDDLDHELRKIEEQLKNLETNDDDDDDDNDDNDTDDEGEIDNDAESYSRIGIDDKLDADIEIDDNIDSGVDDDIAHEVDEVAAAPKKLSKKEKKKQKYASSPPATRAQFAVEEEDELSKLAKALEEGKTFAIDESDDDWGTSKKDKKDKKKKNKGTSSVSGTASPAQTSEPKEKSTGAEICTVCSSTFPSRNKLFQHVNATGHALAPSKKSNKNKKKK